MPRLWLLNFDADDELAKPVGYHPSAAVVRRFEPLARRASGLVPPGDLLVREWIAGDDSGRATGCEGRAFCPTPRARRVLAKHGVVLGAAPSLEVLQRVNGRRFCAELGQTLPFARFVESVGELEETLRSRKGPWLLKRAFGFAGRGRQRMRDQNLDPAVLTFAQSALAAGHGLQVEPWVERSIDVALHGFVDSNGTTTLGAPTEQIVDDMGAWVETVPLTPGRLSEQEVSALCREAARTAAALHEAGYFGPFNVDAYRFRDDADRAYFNTRSEINARYSMGWAIGMGKTRPDLVSP